jgi:hypothetical protein
MTDVNPYVKEESMAAESAALAESNDALSERIDGLIEKLSEKTEKTRLTAVWSLVINFAHIAVTVLAVLFGLGYVDSQNAIRALAECTSTQFEVQQSNTTLLRDAAAKERSALRALVDVIAKPESTLDQRREAFLAYQAGLHAADVQRTTIQPVTRCTNS